MDYGPSGGSHAEALRGEVSGSKVNRMEEETLAHRLGTTAHVSLLLKKAERLGLRVPEDLWILAVQRGCCHYSQGNEPEGELLDQGSFSNEELALSLLTIAGAYDPHSIRCGAAMLGALGNDVMAVARLAKWERSEAVVRYVAECGMRFEPENGYWKELLTILPPDVPLKSGVMPHPTRFVAMNGFEPGVGEKLTYEWQRPAA